MGQKCMLEGLEFGCLSGVLFFSHSLLVMNSYGSCMTKWAKA